VGAIHFVADVHLGRLARYLRLLGFDVVYENNYTTTKLKYIAVTSHRTLLTRNTAFSKLEGLSCFIINSNDARQQLKDVVQQLQLAAHIQPFTRCMMCNALLHVVDKQQVISSLEKNTQSYYDAFWQCARCHRIYWKGSHYERMLQWVNELITRD
jgi:uncharacterized protein